MNAQDKKARRSANRKLRAMGIDSEKFNLLGKQIKAEAVFCPSRMALTGQAKRLSMKKQYEKDHWLDRGTASPAEYHKDDQTFKPMVLDVKKRYLTQAGAVL